MSSSRKGGGGRKEGGTHVQEVDLLQELLLMEFQFTHLEFCRARNSSVSDVYEGVRTGKSTYDLNEIEAVEGGA